MRPRRRCLPLAGQLSAMLAWSRIGGQLEPASRVQPRPPGEGFKRHTRQLAVLRIGTWQQLGSKTHHFSPSWTLMAFRKSQKTNAGHGLENGLNHFRNEEAVGSNPMPSTNRLFKQVNQAWLFGRVGREILFEACGDFPQTRPPHSRLRRTNAGRSYGREGLVVARKTAMPVAAATISSSTRTNLLRAVLFGAAPPEPWPSSSISTR